MDLEDPPTEWRQERLAERYTVGLAGYLMTPIRSGVLRRAKTVEIQVEIADLSLTGAKLLVAMDSPLATIDVGAKLDLVFAGEPGEVRVCWAGEVDGGYALGVDFVGLSPDLREIVFHLIEAYRGDKKLLATAWSSAR